MVERIIFENVNDGDELSMGYFNGISKIWITSGLNIIRMLQDRSIDFSKGGFDWFGDAYSDSNGRMNSVNGSGTTAIFNTDVYEVKLLNESANDTPYDPNSFTNVANAFNESGSNRAEKVTYNTTGAVIDYLGTTFSAKTVTGVWVKASNISSDQPVLQDYYMELQQYDGSSWTPCGYLAREYDVGGNRTLDAERYFYINEEIQGLRVKFYSYGGGSSADHRHYLYYLTYGTDNYGDVVEHNVEDYDIADTLSTSIGVPMIWETNKLTSVQYKLKNATEDTGYLDINQLNSNIAFTSKPTLLDIKINNTVTPVTSPILNRSFEDTIGAEWVYSEVDTNGTFSDGGRVTDMRFGESNGSYSYKITANHGITTANDYARITQTGVDLTNLRKISFDYSAESISGSSDSGYRTLSLVIGNATDGYTTLVEQMKRAGDWGRWENNNGYFSADIPETLRKSGQTIYIQILSTWSSGSTDIEGVIFWFDNISYEIVSPSIKGFAIKGD